jgi:hypothetical protein
MSYFEKGLINRWNLKPYTDPTQPTLFFGSAGLLDTIQNHKGFGIVYPVDQTEVRLNEIPAMKNIVVLDMSFVSISDSWNKYKGEFQFKDYTSYKPNKLGDCIYTYHMPWHTSPNITSLLNIIQSETKYKIIYPSIQNINQFLSEEELKQEYYDRCFVNLNITEANGLTTTRELAMMGRMTISNVNMDYKCFIPYNSVESILDLIEIEATKIGTIQPSIDVHTLGDEWMDVNFWKNKFNLEL